MGSQGDDGKAIVYLIRHGEKPLSGNDLSTQGEERAQALVDVFGKDSGYNIGTILAEKPRDDGSHARPSETVTPLAESLHLPINESFDRDDSAGVARFVQKYPPAGENGGKNNILICWEHKRLTDILTALGVPDAPQYPGKRFDLIYTVPSPYDRIVSTTSEDVQGLDHVAKVHKHKHSNKEEEDGEEED